MKSCQKVAEQLVESPSRQSSRLTEANHGIAKCSIGSLLGEDVVYFNGTLQEWTFFLSCSGPHSLRLLRLCSLLKQV
ncbi:hypothetical protein ACROYT_G003601 [Oculina patagonica]